MSDGIGLAEFLAQVKRDLLQGALPGDGQVPLLSVEEVELEIKIGVTREARGGVNIHVFELGGDAAREDVQVVRVKLAPILDAQQRLAALNEAGVMDEVKRNQVKLYKGGETTTLLNDYPVATARK